MRELNNLKDNHVFTWVDDHGQSAVSSKWVFTHKQIDGSSSLKARLVARGFEGRQFSERTDSPTCSRQSLRIVFVVCCAMGWQLNSLDITSAFLQGNAINREVFIRPPAEMGEEGKVWKLQRCLYGLNDAPREWYNRLYSELKKLNGKVSKYDSALFFWYNESAGLIGIFVSHVDDFVFGGTIEWHNNVMNKLTTVFKISKREREHSSILD